MDMKDPLPTKAQVFFSRLLLTHMLNTRNLRKRKNMQLQSSSANWTL